MSREVFLMVEQLNQKELETQLALQCAPLLTGVKIANLLIVDASDCRKVFQMFERTDISVALLGRLGNKVTFLLYREEEVLAYLSTVKVKKALKTLHTYGWQKDGSIDFPALLSDIAGRYQDHLQRKKDFPHELGLLLGYPPEDVLGFVRHQGKNYRYSGYWKVYENLEEALLVFERYQKARELLIRWLAEGKHIYAGGRQYE